MKGSEKTMKITIELSERQEHFLRQFAEKQYDGSPDNLGTRSPIFVVERAIKLPAPEGYGDGPEKLTGYYNGEFYGADTAEELIRAATGKEPIPLDEAVQEMTINVDGESFFILDTDDYLKAYGIEDYEIIGTHITYTPVAFFLTLEEAKRYRDGYQRHNCGNCRIYGYALGYSNKGDLPEFRDMLMKIGTALLNYERDGVNID